MTSIRSTRLGRFALGAAATGAGLAALSHLVARDAERRVPADGRFVQVGGARLHFTDQGAGPALVMVHGLGGQLRNFTYALADRLAGDFRVVAVDRPGSGYSRAAPGPWPDVRAQGRLVAEFVETLGLDRPVLVGHSLGGAVALAAAVQAPERVGGLALLAPLTRPLDKAPEAFRLLQRDSALARSLIARTVGVPLGRLTAPASLKLIFAPDPVPDDFPVRGGGLLALRPANMEANSFEISAAKDDMEALVPRYGAIRQPVSILYGRGDNLLDPELHGRRTADEIPGGELELIDGGHMLPVTHPAQTEAFVRRAAARRV